MKESKIYSGKKRVRTQEVDKRRQRKEREEKKSRGQEWSREERMKRR